MTSAAKWRQIRRLRALLQFGVYGVQRLAMSAHYRPSRRETIAHRFGFGIDYGTEPPTPTVLRMLSESDARSVFYFANRPPLVIP